MIYRVFGIKVRMSGLSINWYRPIIGRLLNADCLIGASQHRNISWQASSRRVNPSMPATSDNY